LTNTLTHTFCAFACSLAGTGEDASSFSDNLVAQYLSHFLAYLEPEPSDDKAYVVSPPSLWKGLNPSRPLAFVGCRVVRPGGRGEEENRTYYSLEDAFDAVSTSARPTKTFRTYTPALTSTS
jgi:hypothetical protein